jgi:hypothetical protein
MFSGRYIATSWHCKSIVKVSFVPKKFAYYLYLQHIMHEINMYYIPQQNGFIEHDDQTIIKVAHNMLYVKSFPLCMWVKGYPHYCIPSQ